MPDVTSDDRWTCPTCQHTVVVIADMVDPDCVRACLRGAMLHHHVQHQRAAGDRQRRKKPKPPP